MSLTQTTQNEHVYLFDTNAVSDIIKRFDPVQRKFEAGIAGGDMFILCQPVHFESQEDCSGLMPQGSFRISSNYSFHCFNGKQSPTPIGWTLRHFGPI